MNALTQKKKIAAIILPWIFYLGFAGSTLIIENVLPHGSDILNSVLMSRIALYLLIGMGVFWIACRAWLCFHQSWSIFSKIAAFIGMVLIETAIAFVVYVFWTVGMIGGPINPG